MYIHICTYVYVLISLMHAYLVFQGVHGTMRYINMYTRKTDSHLASLGSDIGACKAQTNQGRWLTVGKNNYIVKRMREIKRKGERK